MQTIATRELDLTDQPTKHNSVETELSFPKLLDHPRTAENCTSARLPKGILASIMFEQIVNTSVLTASLAVAAATIADLSSTAVQGGSRPGRLCAMHSLDSPVRSLGLSHN
jgi:hypothetical protein